MLNVGEVIDGKYRIVRLLGEGGMGAVYEGENLLIHRRVAIKVLHSVTAADPSIVQRFEREAQAAGRIGSEHIVEVLDLGTMPSGDRYMVMEFMDGEPLTKRIETRGRLSVGETYPIMRQVLEALRAAHSAGIIHRDLKPDNVYLITRRAGLSDFLKLLDFGISKFAGTASGMRMTQTGAVMGTPYYLSPEQAKGSKDTDHRTDIYAAGVIMYECVTGNVPYSATNFNELMFKIVLEEATPVETYAPDLDPDFAAIIRKAMARNMTDRFSTAEEFREALDAWADTHSHLLGEVDMLSNAGIRAAVQDERTNTNLRRITGGGVTAAATRGHTAPGTDPGMILAAHPEPPRRSLPLFAGLAAAAVLLLVAGFVLAPMTVGVGVTAEPKAAATPSAAVQPAVTTTATPAKPTLTVVPSAAAEPAVAAPATPSASAAAATPQPVAAAAVRAPDRRTTTTKPEPKTEPKTAGAQTGARVGGRIVRSTID